MVGDGLSGGPTAHSQRSLGQSNAAPQDWWKGKDSSLKGCLIE